MATLKHISSVGGVPLDELIAKLRDAVGQPPISASYDDEDYFGQQPDWFSADKVSLTVEEGKRRPTWPDHLARITRLSVSPTLTQPWPAGIS